jgi:hypothetical protein
MPITQHNDDEKNTPKHKLKLYKEITSYCLVSQNKQADE